MSLTARPTPAGRMGRDDHGVDSPFGYSSEYRGGKYFHHGEDYYFLNADVAGSRKVFAAGEGTVVSVVYYPALGLCISIDHGGFQTRSCHMPRDSNRVSVGQQVTDQTFLGPMGNAGTDAFGEFHLHFEVWVNGVRVDPEPYFTATAGGDLIPIIERREIVRIIQDDETQEYWRVGEASALLLAPSVATQEAALWGNGILLPHATVLQVVADALAVGAALAAASKGIGVGGTVDNKPVLSAVAGVAAQVTSLDSKVSGFPAPPTAEKIATAVNNDAAARLAQ